MQLIIDKVQWDDAYFPCTTSLLIQTLAMKIKNLTSEMLVLLGGSFRVEPILLGARFKSFM
jgi:hypothetical protein